LIAVAKPTQLDSRLLRRRNRAGASGFTLIEPIIVMSLIAVLALFIMPRLLDTDMWRLRAFADDMQSQLRAMQRLALAQRRPVVVTSSASGLSFDTLSGTHLADLACPATAGACIAQAGNSSSITFNYANSGASQTSTGATLTLTVSAGDYSQAYQLENETGLIYSMP
jgi:prepilin-type N-terminal cleavage/methylation domain-containing protein